MATKSGYALNNIIPKGMNNLNKLLEVFLRFRTHVVAFHNDVNKMYNGLKLKEEFWGYQRYLFEPTLDPSKPPLEKVITTAIYGVRSAGNQATVAIRKLAARFKSEYPEVYEVICLDHYVDDCLSGAPTIEAANKLMDELQFVYSLVKLSLKTFTVSGQPADKSLVAPDGSKGISGHLWWPEEDVIGFDIQALNFARKTRGRKVNVRTKIPKKLTRRICCSKVGEVFDMSGLLTPITGTWKIDFHDLVTCHLAWDDAIPNNLRPVWETNFKHMSEIKDLRYQRAVVPADAANLDIETLEFGDASKVLVCAAIYVRFLRKDKSYSCQLLVPDETSQPRGELFSLVVLTHSGEVVRRALNKYQKKRLMFSDSQVALHWFSNDTRVLKQWVRNRCIEIRRLSDLSTWRYVRSGDMIADIGTRRCISLHVVSPESVWITGFDWIRKPESEHPSLKIEEITLNKDELELAHKEMLPKTEIHNVSARDHLLERYRFSEYIIDPNRHHFHSTIRILALVYKYVRILHERATSHATPITTVNTINVTANIFIPDEDIASAETYFFRKATSEVKEFLKPNQYERISTENNNILYYSGRVLPEDEVTIVGRATKVMKDLYSPKRTTIKILLLVFCCCTTSATKIKTMESYSTTAFIQSFTRFACDMGYPKRLLVDEGSQLVKGCKTLKLNFMDLQYRLHRDVDVEFQTCPVGGHNMHGKVERRIRHIKESLEKSISNERLGVLQWETVAAITANCINDLPLATRGLKGDLDNLDLITPNRLLLGRNNDRSPVGNMSSTESYDKIIEANAKIFNAWFENWLATHVPQLMDHPKWFQSSADLKEGDVVLFAKHESELSNVYQYGIIDSIQRSRDGIFRNTLGAAQGSRVQIHL